MTVTLVDISAAAAAGASWIMIVPRLIDIIRDPRSPARYVLLVGVAAAAVSLTVHSYARHAHPRLGPLGDARLLSNCSLVVALAAAHLYLGLRNRSSAGAVRMIGRQTVVAVFVVAALVLLFLAVPPPASRIWATPVPSTRHNHITVSRHADYTLLLLSYIMIMLIKIALLSARYTEHANRPLLRLGLCTFTAGAVLGIIGVELDIVRNVLAVGWGVMSAWSEPFSTLLLSTAALLMLGGGTLPSWGRYVGLERAANMLSAMRACARLRPLWADLRSRVQLLSPGADVALLPETTNVLERLAQAPVRLVRLVAEISESVRLLADVRDADVADRAALAARTAGLHGVPLAAAVEAAILAAIVHGPAVPATAPATIAPLPEPHADVAHIGLADDFLANDAAWLLAVAEAYRRTRRYSQAAPTRSTASPAS